MLYVIVKALGLWSKNREYYRGLVIYQMKLESGTFKLPVFDEESHTFKTSWQELMLMVRGLDIDKNTRKKRWEKPVK